MSFFSNIWIPVYVIYGDFFPYNFQNCFEIRHESFYKCKYRVVDKIRKRVLQKAENLAKNKEAA